MFRKLVSLVPFLIAIALGIFVWEKIKQFKSPFAETSEVNHNIILQKVTAMGKLELVKYRFKDLVESKISKQFLPDAKVLLIVEGEAVGCVDFTKINSTKLIDEAQILKIELPNPEICYYKIDHSKSKVYDTQFALLDETKLIENAYKEAENNIQKTAIENGILEQTKVNATKILQPILEKMANKKVVIHFALKDTKRNLK
ncbi:MAG: DUF4230 domain-containing protein [Pseudarcicella sp.]|nr:DUF4230 domain-containing protein [Pseudarcicella sp.]MBP6410978.1 DUF4230 domain-containing protein [Pseudarcicella sp.]